MRDWQPYVSLSCPHCNGGRVRDCCVCRSAGRLFQMWEFVAACMDAWARADCRCLACKVNGPRPA